MTLKEQWNSFHERIIPATAGHVQRKEMRRAFYAGAATVYELIDATAAPNVTEDQGVEVIEAIHQELLQFGKDVADGLA